MSHSFKNFINESINDKGIMKAIFIVGMPGSGKSYTYKQLKGTVSPVLVNTDHVAEFMSMKINKPINNATWSKYFKDKTHKMTESSLFNYVNGMLPLFIDGTSNNVSSILHRIGILESIGYDVGMIFMKVDLDTAIRNVNNRHESMKKLSSDDSEIGDIMRYVDEDFIRSVHANERENRGFLKQRVNFYREISNNAGELTDDVINESFKAVRNFYLFPVQNPIGKRVIQELKEEKEKYLIPTVMSPERLKSKIDGWYS